MDVAYFYTLDWICKPESSPVRPMVPVFFSESMLINIHADNRFNDTYSVRVSYEFLRIFRVYKTARRK